MLSHVFEYEIHRQWLAEFECNAEIARRLPVRERHSRLRSLAAAAFRRRARVVAPGHVGAHACR